MTHKKKIGTVAYYVVGILIAILAIIPFLWMVSTSLKARGALMSIPIEWIPKEPTVALNCTPFVRQYDILSNKWGVLLCQKEYQTNDIRRNSKNW